MQISVFLGVSIDGFIAHLDGGLGFLEPFAGGDHGYADFMRTVDALVVGRATYDTVLGFAPWPWADQRVVVLTHRPLAATHGERAHAGPLAPLMTRLAAEGVGRVYLDGGNAIRGGLDEDLVDDLTLTVVPRTLGAGRPLFGIGAERLRAWQLTGARTLDGGLAQLCYRRVRPGSPRA